MGHNSRLDRAGQRRRVELVLDLAGLQLGLDAADPVRRGGTGRRVDWKRAAEIARQSRVILAGGLTPENVADAIATVRPFGIDVSSGVEVTPGVKDVDKMARFFASAREAAAECERQAVERR